MNQDENPSLHISSAYLWRILNWQILGRQTQRQPRTWPMDSGWTWGTAGWFGTDGHGILSMKKHMKMLAKSNDPKEKWKTPEIHKKQVKEGSFQVQSGISRAPALKNQSCTICAFSKPWYPKDETPTSYEVIHVHPSNSTHMQRKPNT